MDVNSPEHKTTVEGEEFLKKLQELCQGISFQKLTRISMDNDELRRRNQTLDTAYERNLDQLIKTSKEVENLKASLKEKDERIGSLMKSNKDLEESLASSQKQASEAHTTAGRTREALDKLGERYNAARKEVLSHESFKSESAQNLANVEKGRLAAEQRASEANTKATKLGNELTQLKRMLAPLSQQSNEYLAGGLESAFNSLSALARQYIGDLDGSSLEDTKAWQDLKEHVAIKDNIYLSASNSKIAKVMRQAAMLAICSEALSWAIFRLTYSLSEDQELHGILEELAFEKTDSQRSNFIRSAILPLNPEGQSAIREASVKAVVKSVFELTKPLLSTATEKDSFREKLEKVVSELCDHWLQVQNSNAIVRSSLDINSSEDWNIFSPQTGDSDRNHPSATPAGGRTNGNGSKGSPKPVNPKTNSKPRAEAEPVRHGIWPAFTIIRNDGTAECLLRGFALSTIMIKDAKDDEFKTPIPLPSRRVARQNQRNQRKLTNPESNITMGNPFLVEA